MVDKNKLKEDYERACNAYLNAFCSKHGFQHEMGAEWVNKEIGGVACCGDCYFDMATIRADIDSDASEYEIFRWYDYTLDASEFNLPVPNYRHWLMGCPRTAKEWFDNMRTKREELDNLIKEENNRTKK